MYNTCRLIAVTVLLCSCLSKTAFSQIADQPVLDQPVVVDHETESAINSSLDKLLIKQTGNIFTADKMQIEIPDSTSPLVMKNGLLKMVIDFVEPDIKPALSAVSNSGENEWLHQKRTLSSKNLAGHIGQLITDTFSTRGTDLLREIWVSPDGDAIAIRLIMTNKKAQIVQLNSLIPVRLSGPKSFEIGDSSIADFDFLLQKRLKNERPRVIPHGKVRDFSGDQFVLTRSAKLNDGPAVLIGFLS